MSEKRSFSLLLYDICQSVEKIDEFTRGISFDQLMADERTKDAILRNLQVIGEASKNLPESLIADHPERDYRGPGYCYAPVFPGRLASALDQYSRRITGSQKTDPEPDEGRAGIVREKNTAPGIHSGSFSLIPGDPRSLS
jgi:hypothetical protein